jgi:hypothetical protein
MKRYAWLAAAALAMSAGFYSCQKDSGPYAQTNTSSSERIPPPAANGDLTAGKWVMASFTVNGNDHTADFTGYIFRFADSRDLYADGDMGSVKGKWAQAANDNPNSLIMEFYSAAGSPFGMLNAEWRIMLLSPHVLSLVHVGDGGAISVLRFKNVAVPPGTE